MSVLIKWMQMPQNCYDCRLLYDCYSCKVTGTIIDYDRCENERLADCPLIELPGHGDLIDKDEQIERAWRLKLDTRELIAEMLNTAPVVIPAERSEE